MSDFKTLLAEVEPIKAPEAGKIVTVTVLAIGHKNVLCDVNGQFTGIISGTDLTSSIVDVRKIEPGHKVDAMIRGEDRDTGLVILSLRKASQVQLIERLTSNFDTKETITVIPNEANKGGLLVDLDGMKGFIPVSQLSPEHYPRVEGANPERILEHLRGLVGKELTVRVLNVDTAGKKIIFSEKATQEEKRLVIMEKLKLGDVVDGVVSGILSYGLFVTFEGVEGLVHVSEIDWGHVADPSRFARVGDKVKVQIIGKDSDKISLSIKRLKKNPWDELAKKYKIGDVVEAPVTKISKFGVFVELEAGINGLIHLSELSHAEVANPEDVVKVGESVKAKIITLESAEKRIGLSLKALVAAPEGAEKKEKKAKKSEEAAEAPKAEGAASEEKPKKKAAKKDEAEAAA